MRRFWVAFIVATLFIMPAEAKASRDAEPEASGQVEVQTEWGTGKHQPRAGFEAEAFVPWAGPDSGFLLRAEGEGQTGDRASFQGLAGWQFGVAEGLALELLAGAGGLNDGGTGSRLLLRWGAAAAFKTKAGPVRFDSSAFALGGRDTTRTGADVADLGGKIEASAKVAKWGRWEVSTGTAAKVGWSAGLDPAAWTDKEEAFFEADWGSRFSTRWSPVVYRQGTWGWATEFGVGPSETNLTFLTSGDWSGRSWKAELRWKEKF